MSDATDDVQVPAGPEYRLYRAVRWGLLGGASGIATTATVFGLFFLVAGAGFWFGLLIIFFLPGLPYGLVVGIALGRRGLANRVQKASLAILSACAWLAVAYVWSEWYFEFNLSSQSAPKTGVSIFIEGLELGVIWAALQTACFAIIFPFARRPLHLGACLIAGICASGMLASVNDYLEADLEFGLGIIWTGWYAVYTAALSTALPDRCELKTRVSG